MREKKKAGHKTIFIAFYTFIRKNTHAHKPVKNGEKNGEQLFQGGEIMEKFSLPILFGSFHALANHLLL